MSIDIVYFISPCRIWPCDTSIGGREDLLYSIRADRDPAHSHNVHRTGRAPHDTHRQTATYTGGQTRTSLPNIPCPLDSPDYCCHSPASVHFIRSGSHLLLLGAKLELSRCFLLLFYLHDNNRVR